jgi:tetratricopeptide (TPR) repeat protein
MRIKSIHIFSLFIFLLSFPINSDAQKGRSNVSDTKLREAEFYFTEGEKYYILEDYAKALVLFQKSLDIDPKNATVYFKIGQVYSKGNELPKALENANKALELNDSNKYFYLLVADIYTQMGNFAKSAETYEKLIGKVEKTEVYLFELAALYLYQQRYDDALSTYSKIESTYGVSEEVTFQKQKIYIQLNKLDKAIEEGNKLINLFPDEESYVLKQAEILISNDRQDEAKVLLNNFATNNAEAFQSRIILAELKRRSGDITGALEDLKITFENENYGAEYKIQLLAEYRVGLTQEQLEELALPLSKILIETHADVADTHTIYADLLQQMGKSKASLEEYKKSLKIDPSNFAVWQNTIQLQFELNELDSAITSTYLAIELFPNQGILYYYNGAANLQKENYEEATYSLEQGKKLSSSNLNLISVFNSMLGDAYNGIKEYEKSDAAFDASLDFEAENYPILNNYSYYLSLRKEKLDKAEVMAKKVIDNNPNNVTYLDTYAWVLYTNGKYKDAKKVMEKALNIGGVQAIHYEHYGDILYKLGEIDKAVQQWNIAKGMNPDSSLLDKKIADRKLYE